MGGEAPEGGESAVNEGAEASNDKPETATSAAALVVGELSKMPDVSTFESILDLKVAEIEKMIGWYEECPEPEQGWKTEYESVRLFFRGADYPAHQKARAVTRLMQDGRIRVVSHLTQLRLHYKGKAEQIVSNDFVGTMTNLGVDLGVFGK